MYAHIITSDIARLDLMVHLHVRRAKMKLWSPQSTDKTSLHKLTT